MQYVTIGSTNTILSFKEHRVPDCNGGQRKSKAFSPLIIVPATPLISMLKRMHVYVLCFLEDNLYLQQPTKYKWTSLLLLLNTCWCWYRCVTSEGKMEREIVGQSWLPKSWETGGGIWLWQVSLRMGRILESVICRKHHWLGVYGDVCCDENAVSMLPFCWVTLLWGIGTQSMVITILYVCSYSASNGTCQTYHNTELSI